MVDYKMETFKHGVLEKRSINLLLQLVCPHHANNTDLSITILSFVARNVPSV